MKKLKTKEPKLLTLILTASSGIFLGVLLGITILLSRPAKVVTSMDEDGATTERGDYTSIYMKGRVSGTETSNLRGGLSRLQRRSPGPVSFSEAEINYFFGQLGKGDKEETTEETPDKQPAKIGPFNLRIQDDRMFANLKVVVDPQGDPFELLAVAELKFENSESGPTLSVTGLRLNSLPIPGLGGLVTSLVQSKIAETAWPEEFIEMWQNVKTITLEDGQLIAEVGLRQA
ncbi:hypothetical protein [Pelagicoccus albus]|uniref:Uncharacterized protein n=1 Tax=Pelagicoccus albus TaxID=415222 RepID=A0A7X1B8T1_9BACT|nr:hypothetical protein [Pelagicoccus albus]MBC2607799.1 hypothetical protein [Pelagicoccus albus]